MKALFITNSIYVDPFTKSGGVKTCTKEYLLLIEKIYEVEIFKVNYHITLWYRLKVKLGINVYSDYRVSDYKEQLFNIISTQSISHVFINLSNCSTFAKVIKEKFGKQVKIILCSHGNESGDYLHDVTRFKNNLPSHKKVFSSYSLGAMLKQEVIFREKYIDAVLTVSRVEESMEKWLGARKVMMVPRTLLSEPISWNPCLGRIGFIADLSHSPNYTGIIELCDQLKKINNNNQIELRIIGTPEDIGNQLSKRYPFITYIGYLDDLEVKKEISTWTLFLNPVFYYSRGVSTKLSMGLKYNIPIVTTSIGQRGYEWEEGSLIISDTPSEMALSILKYSHDKPLLLSAASEVNKIIKTTPNINLITSRVRDFIESI